MRIALLGSEQSWYVRDLQRAADELGVTAHWLNVEQLSAQVGGEWTLRSTPLHAFDAVIVRSMPLGSLEQVIFRMDLLLQAEADGIAVLNPPRALEACIDKYLTTARLAAAGLPVPRTIVCQTEQEAMTAFDRLGRDVVVKPIFGSEGRGMFRVSDPELAWRSFRTLERTQRTMYLQAFVPHPGYDIRAFVLGGRVLAAMQRWAQNDWRTNVTQGATTVVYRLSRDEERLALRAAQVLGTWVAGVDLFPGTNGERYVLEVNGVPGWRALAATVGRDIAKDLLRWLIDRQRGA